MNRETCTLLPSAALLVTLAAPLAAQSGPHQPGANDPRGTPHRLRHAPNTGVMATERVLDVSGNEEQLLLIDLKQMPDAEPNSPRVVKTLPKHGTLFQRDMSPITSPGTAVTDPGAIVFYQPYSDVSGEGVDRFVIEERAPKRDRREAFCGVRVSLSHINDAPATSFVAPPIFEGTPVVLDLSVSDPDSEWGAESHQVRLVYPPSPTFGTFYQLEPDGVTPGEPLVIGSLVTNPQHKVLLVPNGNYHGNAANFIYDAVDAEGEWSNPAFITLNIFGVNDAPQTFNSGTNLPYNNTQGVASVSLSGHDIDMATDGVSVPGETPYAPEYAYIITELPTAGTLYYGGTGPEHEITEPGFAFSWSQSTGQQLKYIPDSYVPASPYDQFTYVLSDGVLWSAPSTFTIHINWDSTPPVLTPSATYVEIDEDTEFVEFTFSASDVDEPAENLAMWVAALPEVGVLNTRTILWELAPQWLTVDSPGYGIYGDPPVVRYLPAPGHNTMGQGPITFAAGVDDSHNDQDIEWISIVIRAVNDAPLVVGPGGAVAHVAIPGGAVTNAHIGSLMVFDDAGDQPVVLTLEATNATQLILNDPQLLAEFQQVSPTSMMLVGSTAQINAALAAGVQYVPAGLGAGAIYCEIDDLGGGGEPDEPIQALTGSFTVNVITVP